MTRKVCAAILVLLYIFSTFHMAYAEDGSTLPFMVALGDSITTGYEMEGGRYGCANYVNLAAQELGLTRENYANYAVNGYKTNDLLELLPQYQSDIAKADILVFDIGYNDILGYIYMYMCRTLGGDAFTMPEMQNTASMLDEETLAQYAAALKKSADEPLFRYLFQEFEQNLRAILDTLQGYNDSGKIYMQSIYNPLAALDVFTEFSENIVGRINRILETTADAYGCAFLDVHDAFVSHEVEYTYMHQYDIHPNEAGHRAICDLFLEALTEDGFLAPSADAPDSLTETTAETADDSASPTIPAMETEKWRAIPWLLILVLVSVVCGTVGFLTWRYRNNIKKKRGK